MRRSTVVVLLLLALTPLARAETITIGSYNIELFYERFVPGTEAPRGTRADPVLRFKQPAEVILDPKFNPDILFFDEPSAGLDPISAKLLDDLIRQLCASLGATIVVVTHELASIFSIADSAVFLDPETKTMLAVGNPRTLRDTSPEPKIRAFLTRGMTDEAASA